MALTDNIPHVAPQAAAGVKTQLVAVDTLCAAAGAWTTSGVISLDSGIWRRLQIMLEVDAQAIGNVVALMPLVSYTEAAPAAGADDWYAIGTTDGTTTTTTMTGAVPTGADYSFAPGQITRTQRGLVYLSPAAVAATDEIRIRCEALDITGAKHFQIIYAESVTGITATPSKIGLFYALGI